jgi:hypothetical protein
MMIHVTFCKFIIKQAEGYPWRDTLCTLMLDGCDNLEGFQGDLVIQWYN